MSLITCITHTLCTDGCVVVCWSVTQRWAVIQCHAERLEEIS